MIMGAIMPSFAFIWGGMIDNFADTNQLVDLSRERMIIFVYVSTGALFAGWMMIFTWTLVGERQANVCR